LSFEAQRHEPEARGAHGAMDEALALLPAPRRFEPAAADQHDPRARPIERRVQRAREAVSRHELALIDEHTQADRVQTLVEAHGELAVSGAIADEGVKLAVAEGWKLRPEGQRRR
jgi:hypothetical protein